MENDTKCKIAGLKAAIEALERQRNELGDVATDTAISGLRTQVSTLESQLSDDEQRRQITIIFSDIAGFTPFSESRDPEDVREILNEYVAMWNRVLRKYGGIAEKFIGDAIMAVFGIPTAHEDDPERAVRAAMDMQQSMQEFNERHMMVKFGQRLNIRIGIHTGQVVARVDIARSLNDLTVVGDAVNTASRIESSAPENGILISHATYRHLGQEFQVETTGPISVKGKSEPIVVYRVKGISSASTDTRPCVGGIITTMVGRDTELKILRDLYENMIDTGELRAITVVGEAGVGKSRLAYEFRSVLNTNPLNPRIIRTHGYMQTQYSPFSLLRELFASRCGIQDSDSPNHALHKLEKTVHEVFSGIHEKEELPQSGRNEPNTQHMDQQEESNLKAHFIGSLLGFDTTDSIHLGHVIHDPRQIRDRAYLYIIEFLRLDSQERPLVLFVEDLHWADESSIDVLLSLMRLGNGIRMLIIALARRELDERFPRWSMNFPESELSSLSAFTRLDLDLLERTDSIRLVDEIFQRVKDLPDGLRALIVDTTEGNPLFIEEMIKMLVEDGVVSVERDAWIIRQDKLSQSQVPPTLTRILQARLDALPEREEATIKWASVIGRVFWDKAVSRIGNQIHGSIHDQEIMGALTDLKNREMVFPQEVSAFKDSTEFIFKHVMLREVAYNSILKRLRKRYHRIIARWLLEQSEGRTGEFAGLIADHLYAADEYDEACGYYRLAGERAAARFANTEAVRYYTRALETASEQDIQLKFSILSSREESLDLIGNREDQRKDIEAMSALSEMIRDDESGVRVALRRSQLARLTGDQNAAITEAEKALELAKSLDLNRDQINAYLLLGGAYARKSEYTMALTEFQHALQLTTREVENTSKHAGSDYKLLLMHSAAIRGLGLVSYRMDEYGDARNYQQRSLEVSNQIGDRRGAAMSLTNIGNIESMLGKNRSAAEYHREALNISNEIGDRYMQSIALNNLAMVYERTGDYESAQSFTEQSLEVKYELGDKYALATSYGNLGDICLFRGRYMKSLDYNRKSLTLRHESEDRSGEAATLISIGEVYQALGEFDEARTYYDKALDLAEEVGNRVVESFARAKFSSLEYDVGRYDSALRIARNALSVVNEIGVAGGGVYVHRYLGHILVAMKRWDEALVEYSRALDTLKDLQRSDLSREVIVNVAFVHVSQNRLDEARECLDSVLEDIDKGKPDGMDRPLRTLLLCYDILKTLQDPRADEYLVKAHDILFERAEMIDDDDLKRSYLENVETNKRILAEWDTIR